MTHRHSPAEHARDARHNDAARREVVRGERAGGPARSIERAAELQRAAEEFRAAFARVRPQRRA